MKTDGVEDRYPLSPMQQGMLFHYLTGDDPGVDILQVQCLLREDLDIPKWKQAWERKGRRPMAKGQIRQADSWDCQGLRC